MAETTITDRYTRTHCVMTIDPKLNYIAFSQLNSRRFKSGTNLGNIHARSSEFLETFIY